MTDYAVAGYGYRYSDTISTFIARIPNSATPEEASAIRDRVAEECLSALDEEKIYSAQSCDVTHHDCDDLNCDEDCYDHESQEDCSECNPDLVWHGVSVFNGLHHFMTAREAREHRVDLVAGDIVCI